MAWNEPGGNNQDPWGGGNKDNNQGNPPDLDIVLKKIRDFFTSLFGGAPKKGLSNQNGFFGLIAALVFVGVYISQSIYIVDEKERVVVLRFGKYLETVGPGLHLYFPPIETKYQEKVTELRTYSIHQQMLTRDENIVEVSMSVQYNIGDVKSYVLYVEQPLVSLEEASQSALRHVVGSSAMHQILTEGREIMGVEVRKRLQDYQDVYKTGLTINKVNIESAQPPKEVQSSFDDVIRAREDEQRAKNLAEAYANKVIPEARGKAKRQIQESIAYRDELIAKAEGEASRFLQLFGEYQKEPKVTRDRLYLETMESLLGNTSKVLVDSKSNNMMYLPLDQLRKQTLAAENANKPRSLALSSSDLDVITRKVTEELNRRVNNARANTERSLR